MAVSQTTIDIMKILTVKILRSMSCEPALVAQLDARLTGDLGGHGFDPRWSRQHSFMEIDHVEIDHEIFFTVILSLLLIQEGQLSVFGKRMCTILVNRLED